MGYVRLYLDITLIFILKGVEMYTISYKTKPPYSKWYFSIKKNRNKSGHEQDIALREIDTDYIMLHI